MKAVVKQNQHAFELSVTDLPTPDLNEGDVLVEVRSVGICGSDLHMYAGHPGYDWIPYPIVLGHEMTGRVVKTTNQALQGKRVVINPYVPCRTCEFCLKGEENNCDDHEFSSEKRAPKSLQYGFRQNGGMAEYIAVPESNVVPISDKITDDTAAILEAVAVGLTAVEKVDSVSGKRIAVFGPGPIGLGIASLLIGLKAEKVVVVGVPGDENRLLKAKELGAQTILTSEKVVESLLSLANGYDAVFDCSGHHSVPNSAIQVMKKGAQLVLVGISTNAFTLTMDQMVRGQIQVIGSYGITKETFQRTIEYAAQKEFEFEKLISGRYQLSEAKQAFEAALNKAAGKVILQIKDVGGKEHEDH